MTYQAEDLEQQLACLSTESSSPELADIDIMSIVDRCRMQNKLDQEVALAVAGEIDSIARAVALSAEALRFGGRLIYVGAGTSGRLGVLDAAECPPTFGTDPRIVQAIIAGGDRALVSAVEGVEDDSVAGAAAMDDRQVTPTDIVVGITASGRTPFVVAAVRRARDLGAKAVGITNNRPSEMEAVTDPTIAVVVGPEFVAGSTRLKAGTAQKLVLNMITTQTMIELGKTYGNAMVDVMVTNAKLAARARRMVREITGADGKDIDNALQSAGGGAKLAIVMLAHGVDAETGQRLLDQSAGKLRGALILQRDSGS